MFSQNGFSRGSSLAGIDDQGLLVLWHLLHESGATLTALLFIRSLFERYMSKQGTGFTGDSTNMTPFWFSYALAEAGAPWRVLQHVQHIADEILGPATDD